MSLAGPPALSEILIRQLWQLGGTALHLRRQQWPARKGLFRCGAWAAL